MPTEMTYTRCPMCKGDLWLAGGKPAGTRTTGITPCPCSSSATPGWAPTGLTLGQIDRMVEREKALAGDPGITPAARYDLLMALRRRVESALDRGTRSLGGG